MASNTDLRVRISADLGDIKQGLGLLRGELAKVKSQANASFSGSGNALSNGIKNAHNELRAFAATYLSLQGAKMLAGIADEATQIRGRIREAKGDYQAILALAKETRTGLLATTDLYTRMERSTRGQGVSQERLLKITKAVNQAVKLSYADTNTANAALTQFAQGLAAGKLRGQDLNSVIAGTPILAEAIAKGLGKQVGEIKKLGEEGKLTTAAVLDALENQAKRLEEEYARVPVTIGDAMTAIRNSFVDYIGKADEANGASQRFAATLQQLAANLPQILDPLLQAITLLIQNFDVLAVFIGTRMALSALPAMAAAIGAVRTAIIAARAATLSWSAALVLLGGPVGIALAALAAALYLVWKRTNDAKVAAEEHRKALADNAEMAKVSAAEALKEAQAKRVQAAATLQAARAALEERRARAAAANTRANLIVGEGRANATGRAAANAGIEARAAQADVASAEKVYKDWGDRLATLAVEMQMPITAPAIGAVNSTAETAAKKINGSTAKVKEAVNGQADVVTLALDQIKRDLDSLDQRLADGTIKLADYFAKRSALQLQDIDLQIQQAQAEAATATSTDQQSRALTEIIKLQRDRAAIGPAAAREQAKAEKEATAATLEALRARQAAILEEQRRGTDYLALQTELGAIGPGEAERQLFELRQRSIAQLRELRASMVAYLASQAADSPEHAAAVAGLQQLDTEIANTLATQSKFRNAVEQQATASLGGFFDDLIDGAKSFKEAFIDMVRSFLSGIAKMIAQELALRAVKAAFSFFSPAVTASAKGNVFGSGGLQGFAKGAAFALPGLMAFANGGAFTNKVFDSPQMFTFGQGGQFGVMGEAGPEAVMPLTRGSDGKLGVQAQGSGAGLVTTPIVAIGDDAIANALAGAAGERVVMTHVRNNWDGLHRG